MSEQEMSEYQETLVLRNNPGMIRDVFWDKDTLVIRQIKADPSNGQGGISIKVFILTRTEWEALSKFLEQPRATQDPEVKR